MKKQIAITFALVAGAMLTLAGCVSMPEGGTQDDSAMMLNYPYVNLSLTEDQTTMNYPWGNTGLNSEEVYDEAMVSLNYPWTADGNELNEAPTIANLYVPSAAFSPKAYKKSAGLAYVDTQSIGQF